MQGTPGHSGHAKAALGERELVENAPELETAVVIATSGRPELLLRTLESVAAVRRPSFLREILVVENGGQPRAREASESFSAELPIRYSFVPEKGKSRALNHALGRTRAELIVFHDDDVRVEEGTLAAYARTAATYGRGHFFGGPLEVDYEEPPAEWLKAYLPSSVTGWKLAGREQYYDSPDFLGANWAAFREDISAAGGFAAHLGPTPEYRALGEERELQSRMLGLGSRGVYVPGAKVWHYVPEERCTVKWALKRRYQQTLTKTLRDAEDDHPTILGVPRWLWRECAEDVLKVLKVRLRRVSGHRRFVHEMKLAHSWGRAMGHRIRSRGRLPSQGERGR